MEYSLCLLEAGCLGLNGYSVLIWGGGTTARAGAVIGGAVQMWLVGMR
ncbi:MAG: hypothetical protein C5S38_09420 [Candidatus Methanophagaceae archaeon]|jgi:hypothetical protein|nr:MAG: hypothetical protein C5S38_09420 [Methanophagales archaeon]